MPAAVLVSPSNVPAGGGTLVQDVNVEGEDEITVIGTLGPTAAAASDVSVSVQPYLADNEATDKGNGPTLADAGLDLVQTTIYPGVAAYLNATDHIARVMVRVDVKGFSKVRLVLKNNNATTALPARLDYFYR